MKILVYHLAEEEAELPPRCPQCGADFSDGGDGALRVETFVARVASGVLRDGRLVIEEEPNEESPPYPSFIDCRECGWALADASPSLEDQRAAAVPISRTYRGLPAGEGTEAQVLVIVQQESGAHVEHPLDPRFDLRRHSPTGFAWGYAGSGPAQLALALLCDALGDDDRARRIYQAFKRKVVTALPQAAAWTLSQDEIRRVAAELEATNAEDGDAC